MKYVAPFSDNAMIPPITFRDEMEKHVEDIVLAVSDEILNWEDSEFPIKKQAYCKLVKKGFQNDEFLWLTQLAVDYLDYLIIGNKNRSDNIIPIGAKKAVEMYLAQLLDKSNQMSTMLLGAQNYYQNLLKEYPELKRLVNEHLVKHSSNLGAQPMSNYYPQPVYQQQPQPVQLQDGQWYYPDGRGGFVLAQQPAPPTLEQGWQGVHNRRASQQYYQQPAPQYAPPPQQQGFQNQGGWGVNPPQPMSTPQSNGGYQGYNPNQQQNAAPAGNGFGPYTGGNKAPVAPVAPPQPPVHHQQLHPQATARQQHDDFAPPTPQGQKIQVARPGTPEARAANAPDTKQKSSALMQTHTGYECEYFAAQNGVGKLKMDIPIVFDATTRKGIYLLDNNMKLLSFKTVNYQENDVDYNQHETSQFFAKMRAEVGGPNKKLTTKVLAEIQRKLFVKETLESVEYRKIEGNVKGDVGEHDLTSPVIIGNPIVSTVTTNDYIGTLLESFPEIDLNNLVVNYEHHQILGRSVSGDVAVEAFKIRRCVDWFQLKEILNQMSKEGLSIQDWSLFNQIITDYINDVLEYHFNIEWKITSFDVDIDELISNLHKEFDIRNDFSKCAAELCRTVMFPHYLDSNEAYLFTEVQNYEIADGSKTVDDTVAQTELDMVKNREDKEADEEEVLQLVFIRLADVTILPIESSRIYIPVPEQDNQWESEKPVACGVTADSFPELYNAIHDRVRNSNYRASEVVFVTRDNHPLHVKKTNDESMYIISRKQ